MEDSLNEAETQMVKMCVLYIYMYIHAKNFVVHINLVHL